MVKGNFYRESYLKNIFLFFNNNIKVVMIGFVLCFNILYWKINIIIFYKKVYRNVMGQFNDLFLLVLGLCKLNKF